MTGPNRTASLAQQVFETLEQKILQGEFVSGEILSENKLSARLGVSRTPIREALARLESEGLLHTEKGKGIVVGGISPEDASDIYEIRLRIEGLAANKCAKGITVEKLETLKHILELQDFYAAKDNAEQMRILDTDFHQAIFEYCDSVSLRTILIDLHHKLQQYRKVSVSIPGRAQKAVFEHRQIYDAIAARDGVLAEQLMVVHIQNAYHNIQTNHWKE